MRPALVLLLLTGCVSHARLTSVSLVDPHGFQQTVTSRERLSRFEKTDFSSPQPYRKVLCVYENAPSVVTSYHPNSKLHQRLEVRDGRACGLYEEYFPDGTRKLSAHIVAGNPDLDPASLQTYVFEGLSRVWDESGHLHAEIPYSCGELHGMSTYYFSDGEISEQISYIAGRRNGEARGYSSPDVLAYVEHYSDDLLIDGDYLTSSIREGSGLRSTPTRTVTYVDGRPHGEVREYSSGQLHSSHTICDGLKDGQEIVYFSNGTPKMSITWCAGEMRGEVKTWYSSGQLQSQREVARNRRSGTSLAWYTDGSLMLIEEYLDDQLVRGEYFGRGNPNPLSQVEGGNGLAVLYDSEGNLLRRVTYVDGMPLS